MTNYYNVEINHWKSFCERWKVVMDVDQKSHEQLLILLHHLSYFIDCFVYFEDTIFIPIALEMKKQIDYLLK